MSRIGNRRLNIPEGVTVTVDGSTVTVKGPKGELTNTFNRELSISVEDNSVVVTRPNDIKTIKSLHGTTNALIKNMIIGVSEGYKKELEIVGVGYRFSVQGNKLNVNAGFSHPVELLEEDGITLECPDITQVVVKGCDKEKVGQYAAKVRGIKPVEPYHAYGIKYDDEHVVRKVGKVSGKK